MNLPVYLTDRAHAELEAAYSWWADNRSKKQAADWYAAFVDAMTLLTTDAEKRPLARENDDFLYEIRNLLFGVRRRRTHRAVFTIRHLAQRDLSPDDFSN